MVNLNEETICGYFVSSEMKRVWKAELNILEEFRRVCEKNNLKFFVAHGTLLGAVRHKGFIPWDDDIDVNMPRQDYERLKKIAPQEFKSPFFFQTFESDKKIFYGHGKLRFSGGTGIDVQDIGTNDINAGLYIDIFPMDGITEDIKKRAVQSRHIEFYRGMLLAKIYGRKYRHFAQYNAKKWLLYKILSLFTCADWLNQKFEEWVTKYSSNPTQRTGIIAFLTDYECCYWYQEDYDELVDLSFEGVSVPAPRNYDRCLKIKWNNYMDFPKPKNRGIKHIGTLLSGDIPYQKYDLSRYVWNLADIKNKKLFLFGAGQIATEFIQFYGKKLDIVGICDNDEARWGTNFNGYKIISPDALKSEDFVCMITCAVYPEIERQLKEYGHKEYFIYLYGRIYH